MSMSIAEAKSKFSAVIDRAAAGEETLITRHGKPVARIVPVRSDGDRERASKAFDRIRILREDAGASLGDVDWKVLRDEGRR